MTEKNIQMQKKNADGSFDIYYPKTKAANVIAADGSNLESHLADYVRQPGYGTTSGSANTYTLALNPALTAYVAGVCVAIKIHAANTGASTLNINGLGAKSIRDSKGNALTSGKLILNGVYTLRYDGTNFILQGEGGSGNAIASDLLSGRTASTDAGDIVGTMPNRSNAWATANLVEQTGDGTILLRPPTGYFPGNDGSRVTSYNANFVADNIKSGVNIFGLVGTLPLGKKWAQGTFSVPYTNQDYGGAVLPAVHNLASVTGLDFTPTDVFIRLTSSFVLSFQRSGYNVVQLTSDTKMFSDKVNVGLSQSGGSIIIGKKAGGFDFYAQVTASWLVGASYVSKLIQGTGSWSSPTFEWYAYGD